MGRSKRLFVTSHQSDCTTHASSVREPKSPERRNKSSRFSSARPSSVAALDDTMQGMRLNSTARHCAVDARAVWPSSGRSAGSSSPTVRATPSITWRSAMFRPSSHSARNSCERSASAARASTRVAEMTARIAGPLAGRNGGRRSSTSGARVRSASSSWSTSACSSGVESSMRTGRSGACSTSLHSTEACRRCSRSSSAKQKGQFRSPKASRRLPAAIGSSEPTSSTPLDRIKADACGPPLEAAARSGTARGALKTHCPSVVHRGPLRVVVRRLCPGGPTCGLLCW